MNGLMNPAGLIPALCWLASATQAAISGAAKLVPDTAPRQPGLVAVVKPPQPLMTSKIPLAARERSGTVRWPVTPSAGERGTW